MASHLMPESKKIKGNVKLYLDVLCDPKIRVRRCSKGNPKSFVKILVIEHSLPEAVFFACIQKKLLKTPTWTSKDLS